MDGYYQHQLQHHTHNSNPPPASAHLVKSSPNSSPPLSPDQYSAQDKATRHLDHRISNNAGSIQNAFPHSAAAPTSNPMQIADDAPPKKTRKKRDPAGASNASESEVKVKKPRKPREPKDPNAPPRKRAKKSDGTDVNGSRASSLHPMDSDVPKANNQPSYGYGSAPTTNNSISGPNGHSPPAATSHPTYAQTNKNESERALSNAPYSHYGSGLSQQQQPLESHSSASLPQHLQHQHQQPQPQAPPPRPQPTQRFDPIRSATLENARMAATPQPQPHYSPPIYQESQRASSAFDPLRMPSQSTQQLTSEPRREAPPRPVQSLAPAPARTPAAMSEPSPLTTKSSTESTPPAVEKHQQPALEKAAKRNSSPKPPRKKATPPLAMGNGLLSGADFGKKERSEPKEYAKVPNQCIVIDVPITQETGNYVNFLQEVEKKYGFDVAHPRIAEHRRRMADMAAAGALIESGTGTADDMSLDLSEPDSDVGMGGVTEDSDAKKKQRRSRMDQYDIADDFIDDTEQAWQEQALASKDGYFVWMGKLVQEGDNPTVERADGTIKRGRGGRGRGASSRGGAGNASGRGRGDANRSTRGTGTTRKPRMKKAERLQLVQEKAQKAAASALPTSTQFPGVVGAA